MRSLRVLIVAGHHRGQRASPGGQIEQGIRTALGGYRQKSTSRFERAGPSHCLKGRFFAKGAEVFWRHFELSRNRPLQEVLRLRLRARALAYRQVSLLRG